MVAVRKTVAASKKVAVGNRVELLAFFTVLSVGAVS